MKAAISLHGRPIESVFDLLGSKENDITYSLGWALSRCPEFRSRVVDAVIPGSPQVIIESVLLQEQAAGGITDIELKGANAHVILEAKSGFELPGVDQLSQYAPRLASSPVPHRALVTVSAASGAFARTRLPPMINGFPCRHLSLSDLDSMSLKCGKTHAEKHLLFELHLYLNRIAKMQDLKSNMVYVVALSSDVPSDSDITWRDIVDAHGMYFHPVGGSYPREPVNYIGFRYDGQLRSIRHVDRCEMMADLGDRIPGCRYKLDGPSYLYTLGPAIVPSKVVRNGKIVMANRVYAAIDLLLTCDTISEAGERTRIRLGLEAADHV